MRYLSPSLYLLVLAVPVAHVLVAPYTKVEESFTLHAARDVLHHGFFTQHALEQYDHRTFPGAVPRSFIPSVIWATLSLPLLRMGQATGWANKGIDEQIVLRIVLAILNGLSVIHVAKALSRRSRSRSTSIFYLVLSISQFHTMFYAGRPLPNFTALPLVNLTVSYLVEGLTTRLESPGGRFNRVSRAVTILALTTSIIRSELALFLVALSLYLLIARKISLLNLVTSGLIGGGGGAVLSTMVDSFFWGRWTWPEFEALVFNVVQGKSEEWGVSPWYSYLLVHLPKITLFSLPLALYALTTGATGRGLGGMMATCILGLVGGLSCLAHKEWRFIVYAVPLVNILAATGAAQIWDRATKRKSMMDKLGGLVLLGGLFLNLVVTIGLTFVSVNNYPGGEAIEALRRVGASSGRSELRVFLPPSVLQTGASRYTFEQDDNSLPRWEFNRTESESLQTPAQIWSAGFDYTITDDIERFLQDEGSEWYMVQAIDSFGGVSLKPTPGPVWSPRLWILSREAVAIDV